MLSIGNVPSPDDCKPADDDPPLIYDPTFSTQVRKALESVQYHTGQPVLAIPDKDPHQTLVQRVHSSIEKAPELTIVQEELAYHFIPLDYWSLVCWSCREPGHSTFTCTRLLHGQRLYFAYNYYLYQSEQHPHMACHYRERAKKRAQREADSRYCNCTASSQPTYANRIQYSGTRSFLTRGAQRVEILTRPSQENQLDSRSSTDSVSSLDAGEKTQDIGKQIAYRSVRPTSWRTWFKIERIWYGRS